MAYRIEFLQEARDESHSVPAYLRPRIKQLIESLASVPRPPRAKELRGEPGLHRVRLESWRIIYFVDDDDQSILIVAVRRKTGPETYEDLPDYP